VNQQRPQPKPTSLTEGFWTAAARHELVVQQCACGVYRHYPQPMCPECLSTEWAWTPVSGSGVVHTFTITHRAFHPAWADRTPFAVATIELSEGVRMISDLSSEDTEVVAIGAPVEVFFDDQDGAEGTLTLPRFRLVRSR
jgi:uncharacterized OB-fold protein